jgi:four helix bundle protein
VLNIAEGAGRRSAADKRRFYEMARGSATETAAITDVLRVRGLASQSQCSDARGLAVRVVQMLSRLVGPAR